MSKWLISELKTSSLHLSIANDPWALRISVNLFAKLPRGELNVESAVVKVSSQFWKICITVHLVCPHVLRTRRHMWVSQPQNSRPDGATTKCHSSTKRSAMTLSWASTCGNWRWRTTNLQCPGRSSQKLGRIQSSVNDVIYVSKRNILL